jgi:hypothetical protein
MSNARMIKHEAIPQTGSYEVKLATSAPVIDGIRDSLLTRLSTGYAQPISQTMPRG